MAACENYAYPERQQRNADGPVEPRLLYEEKLEAYRELFPLLKDFLARLERSKGQRLKSQLGGES